MNYYQKTLSRALALFLILIAYNLGNHIALGAEPEAPENYFGGVKFGPPDVPACDSTPTTNCKTLCPDSGNCVKAGSTDICLCHEEPMDGGNTGYICANPSHIDAGAPQSAKPTLDVNNFFNSNCERKAYQSFRTSVDSHPCFGSGNNDLCLLQDHLEDIKDAINVQFGGKSILFDCFQDSTDFCKSFCPDTLASCDGQEVTNCYCHNDPPTNAPDFTCAKTTTEPKCAATFPKPVDTYSCTSPKYEGYVLCVYVDTEEPDTGVTGGCDACPVEESSLFSFLVCPIVCLVNQVVTFVTFLLTKGLFQIVDSLFTTITSTLDDLVGALGDL